VSAVAPPQSRVFLKTVLLLGAVGVLVLVGGTLWLSRRKE
jgi:hypothetical protein